MQKARILRRLVRLALDTHLKAIEALENRIEMPSLSQERLGTADGLQFPGHLRMPRETAATIADPSGCEAADARGSPLPLQPLPTGGADLPDTVRGVAAQ